MIVIGIVLLVIGYLVPTFALSGLFIGLGWLFVAVGLLLLVLGAVGHPIGGRRHYW